MLIIDGKGRGYKASVDSVNRLNTTAVTYSGIFYASSELEKAYDFSTGDISITSVDTETGVMYMKNTSTTENFYVHTIRTCADQTHKVKLYKNPTTGTLISAATAGSSTNLNFNSSNTASATVYKGAEGATLTDGDLITQHIDGIGHSTSEFNQSLILSPNSSIAITFELAAAGDCCVRIVGHFS